MTAGRDALRAALLEALDADWGQRHDIRCGRYDPHGVLDVLLPVVERHAAEQVAAARAQTRPCPTCVREGGPYRCCVHCADDPWAHEHGERDHHDLPCQTCVRAAAVLAAPDNDRSTD